MNIKNKLQSYLISKVSNNNIFFIQYDITHECNLKCKHCYNRGKKDQKQLDIKKWMNTFRQSNELLDTFSAKAHIGISGGEPLLYDKFENLILNLKRTINPDSITILTNGTLLNENHCIFFKENKLKIQISLDGWNIIINDKIRGMNSFTKILNGIKLLNKFSIPFSLQTTLMKQNFQHIDKLFDIAKKLNAQELNFCRFVKMYHKDNIFELNSHELKTSIENILIFSNKTGIKTSKKHPLWHLVNENCGAPLKLGTSCIIINSNGDVKPSSRSKFICGNIFKDKLINIYLNKHFETLRNSEVIECKTCEHYKICMGGDLNVSYANKDNFFIKDPFCWKV
jgi:radical SAM protein with 4Fe4S-binding SPASM domain